MIKFVPVFDIVRIDENGDGELLGAAAMTSEGIKVDINMEDFDVDDMVELKAEIDKIKSATEMVDDLMEGVEGDIEAGFSSVKLDS